MTPVTAANSVHSGALEGPWERAFWAELPFAARSKSNFRNGGAGAWGALARFEEDVASTVAPFVPDGWELGSPLETPTQRPVVVALVAARTTLDASNLSKSLLDALEGVLYVTDAQVAASVNVGERGRTRQWLSVAFAQLPPDADLVAVTEAAAALPKRWLAARTAALS